MDNIINIEKEIRNWIDIYKDRIQDCSCKAVIIVPQIKTEKNSLYIDVDSENYFARITFWESGECDREALDAKTGERAFWEHFIFNNRIELVELLEGFFQKIHCL